MLPKVKKSTSEYKNRIYETKIISRLDIFLPKVKKSTSKNKNRIYEAEINKSFFRPFSPVIGSMQKTHYGHTNGPTDPRTDGPTDGQTLLRRCVEASENNNISKLNLRLRAYLLSKCLNYGRSLPKRTCEESVEMNWQTCKITGKNAKDLLWRAN